jgi:hypothetical protein
MTTILPRELTDQELSQIPFGINDPHLGFFMGNPQVLISNPHPYLPIPVPTPTGTGFHGYGYGFDINLITLYVECLRSPMLIPPSTSRLTIEGLQLTVPSSSFLHHSSLQFLQPLILQPSPLPLQHMFLYYCRYILTHTRRPVQGMRRL